jgi:hypothetical protein
MEYKERRSRMHVHMQGVSVRDEATWISRARLINMMNEDRIVVPAPELTGAVWRKSSFSGQHQCVEVANLSTGEVAVRHSRQPAGPALVFTKDEWSAFLQGAAHGEFGAAR